MYKHIYLFLKDGIAKPHIVSHYGCVIGNQSDVAIWVNTRPLKIQ